MIIYNVTISLDDNIEADWLQWMKTKHIPDVLATGFFIDHRLLQLTEPEPEEGKTYCIQYRLANMENYEQYKALHAPALQAEYKERYEGKFFAFRTLLKEI